jgi:hypothetical protein
VSTRGELQRVATHVLARRRHDVTGRFGLRATPGGFGTPAFGPPDTVEVVRVAGTTLVHEVGGETVAVALDGSTLRSLAGVVGVDLSVEFHAGNDTPPLGDPDEPLHVDATEATAVADWFDLGWRALDAVGVPHSTIQLWPEHFDVGCAVADRCNLGASPGDSFSEEPYLYVGPWAADDRPGDPAFWNAPFGAVLRRSDLGDPVAFFHGGLATLGAA